ncbi:hypothetical protein SAMN03159341_1457 [Paenibacillus sp. 1_12]|uniref:CvpA family protein n=1 Tax=Paenibacillus sp. 1_12 TaxID=1566278 RepID=UPI0008F030A6|nr:CvpA family protein [Paenibacillus sp. 1_12]SFM53942.1 hypothetical protein SAMN03159341_1457 [Paenibacillus sp. 1_12]
MKHVVKLCPRHKEEMFEKIENNKIVVFCLDCEIDRIYKGEESKHRATYQKIIDENKTIMRKYEDDYARKRVKYLAKKTLECMLSTGLTFAMMGWWVSFIIELVIAFVGGVLHRSLAVQLYESFGEFNKLNYWTSAGIYVLIAFIFFWCDDRTKMPQPQLNPESVPPDRKKIGRDILDIPFCSLNGVWSEVTYICTKYWILYTYETAGAALWTGRIM